jgi:uncharacterized protein YdhG (YjbR/CyaY superfamily)
MNKTKTVDGYINLFPDEIKVRLNDLRKAIKETVPEATERISYAMPYYDYKGRLVYFAAWRSHIGIYAIKSTVTDKFKEELKNYVITKGTIQFPLNEKFPLTLIKKIVKAQADENEKTVKK